MFPSLGINHFSKVFPTIIENSNMHFVSVTISGLCRRLPHMQLFLVSTGYSDFFKKMKTNELLVSYFWMSNQKNVTRK